MADRAKGKVAVVTGAASGVGKSTAMILAQEGAAVVLADLNLAGEDCAAEIRAAGGKATFIRTDVSSESDWNTLIAHSEATFGAVSILVNNAAMSGLMYPDPDDLEGWDKIMSVNARSVYLGTRAVLPAMKAAQRGSIVNVSSIMGLVGNANSHPAYHSSKGAVRLFSKATAARYGRYGIRANSVHPGYLPPMRNMAIAIDEQGQRQQSALESVPLRRRGSHDEVAWGIVFLACDESSYITGAELAIDGGFTAV